MFSIYSGQWIPTYLLFIDYTSWSEIVICWFFHISYSVCLYFPLYPLLQLPRGPISEESIIWYVIWFEKKGLPFHLHHCIPPPFKTLKSKLFSQRILSGYKVNVPCRSECNPYQHSLSRPSVLLNRIHKRHGCVFYPINVHLCGKSQCFVYSWLNIVLSSWTFEWILN